MNLRIQRCTCHDEVIASTLTVSPLKTWMSVFARLIYSFVITTVIFIITTTTSPRRRIRTPRVFVGFFFSLFFLFVSFYTHVITKHRYCTLLERLYELKFFGLNQQSEFMGKKKIYQRTPHRHVRDGIRFIPQVLILAGNFRRHYYNHSPHPLL